MNKYNQLREEIIKAVPDIMALKFGCKIKYDNEIWVIFDDCRVGIRIALFSTGFTKMVTKEIINYDLDYEIIGRDITPIDILKTKSDLAIDGIGGIFIRNHCKKKGDLWKDLWEFKYLGLYDTNKPLQDQSEETKDFLFDLIVKK